MSPVLAAGTSRSSVVVIPLLLVSPTATAGCAASAKGGIRVAADAEPAPFGTLHENDANKRGGNDCLKDSEEKEHGMSSRTCLNVWAGT